MRIVICISCGCDGGKDDVSLNTSLFTFPPAINVHNMSRLGVVVVAWFIQRVVHFSRVDRKLFVLLLGTKRATTAERQPDGLSRVFLILS